MLNDTKCSENVQGITYYLKELCTEQLTQTFTASSQSSDPTTAMKYGGLKEYPG